MNKNSTNNQINITHTISQDQSDMSKGYADGSVSMIVSGFIWLASAIVSFLFLANKLFGYY